MEPPILGIDLGTTHSLVGIVDSGFPILLADAEGQRITPSAVAIPAPADSQEEPLVGARALRQAALTPERCFTSFKRFMGRRVDELEPEEADPRLVKLSEDRIGFRIEGEETVHTPEQLSAYLLIYLRSIAEKALERDDLTRAVITVPAYFNDAQRQATVRAGELAGLTVERILSEPTAAALAYGLDQLPDQSTVAVFDLGGGTFDISVLRLDEGLFRVKSTAGDTRLGGDDVDAAILGWIEEHLSHPVLDDQRTRIRREARAAKEALSDAEEVTLSFPFLSEEHHSSLTLSRTTFEGLWAPLLQRTRPLCLRALADAGLSSPKEELDAVILVGGSTRIPRVRSFVEDLFGHEPNLTQHPDEAVALGAVIQAGMLSGALQDLVLLDVTPLSLGIETFGGLMNIIIPRNTTIPTKAGEMFTNAVSNQESMLIRILQGEREMARDNWELGQIQLPFPPGPKGSARVGVQFQIDANGILHILARDTVSERDETLVIEHAAVDVAETEVESMVAESVDFAFADMEERIWTEATLKGQELLPAVEQALALVGGDLSPEERNRIETARDRVAQALAANPPVLSELREANNTLDEATEHLAALLVEKAFAEAQGK